jgi:phosphoglycerate kinase
MTFKFLTLDDVETSGKTVFLRVDINVPIDPVSKRILDATRIKATIDSIQELKGSRLVLGAHQSRPGKYDFTSLALHSRVLQMYLNGKVMFVDDILGEKAIKAIKALEPGEILVLNNLRMLAEENKQRTPEKAAKTPLVETLAPHFDFAVNDAFAASHRSQPSLVGFGEVVPMIAGRLMQRELEALTRVLENPDRPCVFVLGGAKVEDRIPVMNRVLKDMIADRILIGGLIRETFHAAQENPNSDELIQEARRLLDLYGDKITMPIDVALDIKGERLEIGADKVTDERNIYDIGLNTVAHYCDQIRRAGTVVAEGPLGMFERRFFDTGTKEILRALVDCSGFTMIGGGHLGGMASMMDVDRRMSHVSTGGGAMLSLLAGERMPVVEALERSKERFG